MHGPASQGNVISVTIGKRFSYQQSVTQEHPHSSQNRCPVPRHGFLLQMPDFSDLLDAHAAVMPITIPQLENP